MSQQGPTAKGSLAATPFAHLLIYALDHHLTGTIVFEEPGRAKHAIYLTEGAPVQARAAVPIAPLGGLALESGAVDASLLEVVLVEARKAGRRFGEVLVERRLCDAPALEALLREQIVRRLEFFATLPSETAYGYYEATNFLERAGGPSGYPSPLVSIWRVIRVGVAPERVSDVLARLGDLTLRFHAEAPLGRFDFDPHEQAVIDVLRAKPQPLAEIVGRGLAETAVVELLLYTLSLLRHFDTGSGARPVGSERASNSMRAIAPPRKENPASLPAAPVPSHAAPAPSRPPASVGAPAPSRPPASVGAVAGKAADPFRRELAERLTSTKQSYYQVLGVPNDAPTGAIASAFFQLAKRFHPDRLGPGFDDVRDQATRLFARMTEAHQVLSDAIRRKEYDELVSHGEGAAEEQEEVLRVVRAATSYQKAQVHLKRNNLSAAEAEARQALADDPQQADHIALVAWLEAAKPNADLEAALKVLTNCVKMEEANLRVRWYRGQIQKRLGHERRAIEDFRYIVERDPRHVDAQRELRFHDMQRAGMKSTGGKSTGGGTRSIAPGASADAVRGRRTSSNPPPPGDKAGFFGKFFKK